jgi:hypothetical protein
MAASHPHTTEAILVADKSVVRRKPPQGLKGTIHDGSPNGHPHGVLALAPRFFSPSHDHANVPRVSRAHRSLCEQLAHNESSHHAAAREVVLRTVDRYEIHHAFPSVEVSYDRRMFMAPGRYAPAASGYARHALRGVGRSLSPLTLRGK